jgi:hypothetical protein
VGEVLHAVVVSHARRTRRPRTRPRNPHTSLDSISSATNKVATSQLALPRADCEAVFATTGYEASVPNLAQLTLATDNIFSDGATLQLATVTGNVTVGYVATLTVAVNA